MKARGGFTLVELLLAGAILATISFGALIGTLRINQIVNDRSDLMAADGYCWDVAWKLLNEDYEMLREATVAAAEENGCNGCELSAPVWHKDHLPPDGKEDYTFLPHLESPVCYVTFSNALDSAGNVIPNGMCIGVNLEWGPPGQRSILMRRANQDLSGIKTVYDHPIEVFKSYIPRKVR